MSRKIFHIIYLILAITGCDDGGGSGVEFDNSIDLDARETVISWTMDGPYSYSLPGSVFKYSDDGSCQMIELNEGYSSDRCSISNSNLSLGGPAWLTSYHGTASGGSVTIVEFPHLSTGDGANEDISVYFHGSSGADEQVSAIAPGIYSLEGIEFTASNAGNPNGSNEYAISGEFAAHEDGSCAFTTTEGGGECVISGNEIIGVGDASAVRGTISESQLTMYFNSTDGGELIVGYLAGSRLN